MNIETASGKAMRNVTDAQLREELRSLNEGNDFLILSDGESYIQCAISGTAFIAEYQDNSGHFISKESISAETIVKLFCSYLARSDEWRGMAGWIASGGEADAPAGSQGKTASFAESLKQELSPGNLLGSIKRQVSQEIGKSVNRKASGTVGRILRKFLG